MEVQLYVVQEPGADFGFEVIFRHKITVTYLSIWKPLVGTATFNIRNKKLNSGKLSTRVSTIGK